MVNDSRRAATATVPPAGRRLAARAPCAGYSGRLLRTAPTLARAPRPRSDAWRAHERSAPHACAAARSATAASSAWRSASSCTAMLLFHFNCVQAIGLLMGGRDPCAATIDVSHPLSVKHVFSMGLHTLADATAV